MSDPRFARLKSDPRFRRPKKKQAKVLIDDRFQSVFASEKAKKSGRVDKYGRTVSETHEKDNLKRFYRLENDDADEDTPAFTDYARGDVLLESSDEEDVKKPTAENSDEDEEPLGRDSKRPINVRDDSDAEVDLDETEFADLEAQAAAYAEANPDPAPQEGTPSRRLAVVNLDWDHVRAMHLFKICASLVSLTSSLTSSSQIPDGEKKGRFAKGAPSTIARGKVLNVRVYPSEFGKERMAREQTEGPPPEIFKKKVGDEEEVNAQNIYDVGGEDDYDKDALRKYQLERLRYYYGIITCDTVDAATHIYQELEGTELERSANVFDLSYVPDDMSFDGDFRDEATNDSEVTFKGVDFVTDVSAQPLIMVIADTLKQALRHSKVKLTWDEDDPERNQLTRRTLTKKEIEDADFGAFLASSSESEPEVVEATPKSKVKDKKSSRDKLRALLLGGNDDLPEGWDREDDPGDVDMEITFTPGLSEQKEDETTLDKYQRKMREKRKKRKDEVKEKTLNSEVGNVQDNDDFFDVGSDSADEAQPAKGKDKKSRRKATRQAAPESSVRPLSTPEELALLVASDDPGAETKHFNLKSVLKAEKKARRKGKTRKNDNDEGDNELQEDFRIDVNDERFKILHEDHQYAIDPTNPQFKKTVSMDAFLQERSRRKTDVTPGSSNPSLRQHRNETEGKTLKSLVESVKRKSANSLAHGTGKRRKI
ncbi:hypothetical protein DXG01_000256 [Tephrocybe rancida]|nr:hypothetical protein DXG01_000256 [Tephrocybe rancida]